MGRFSDVLLVSDFDRTLTRNDSTIPQQNLDAIAYFMDEGGIFTIATGRSLPLFRQRAEGLPLKVPVLLYNGAACYDFGAQKLEFCIAMPDELPQIMGQIMDRYPELRAEVQCLDAHYCFGQDALRDEYLAKSGVTVRYRPWSEIPKPWVKASFYAPFRQAGHCLPWEATQEEDRLFSQLCQWVNETYKGAYTATQALPRMMELERYGVSKGTGARKLANTLGRSILVCAGDAPNDLTMLEEAEYGYVPADCDAKIRGRGFLTAASCGEGAVADIVAQLEKTLSEKE